MLQIIQLISGLSRLLSNPGIRVRQWYEPIARQWLETQFGHIGEVRLIVDFAIYFFAAMLV